MTKEQAIDLLDNLIGFIEDNHGSDYDEALKIAIKALEQEPFINKLCVSTEACKYDKNKVFDKIRAEIEEARKCYEVSMDYIDAAKEQELGWVLEIIDKYRAESEENNGTL